MATSKKVKVLVMQGCHVSTEGAQPGDERTRGVLGKIYRAGETVEITEEELAQFPNKFQPL